MFREAPHHRPVKAKHVQVMFGGGVHGDAAYLADLSKGYNVCDGVWVLQDFTKVREVSNHV